jgi:hypothetical protein
MPNNTKVFGLGARKKVLKQNSQNLKELSVPEGDDP